MVAGKSNSNADYDPASVKVLQAINQAQAWSVPSFSVPPQTTPRTTAPVSLEAPSRPARRRAERAKAKSAEVLPPTSEPYPQRHKLKLRSDALYGLAGEIVSAVSPFTEAATVALLMNVLTAFGNVIGRGSYFKVEETPHFMNMNIVFVGDTSKGRKGQSWSQPRAMFEHVDPWWAKRRITSGLSSGEGLIFHVRDADGNDLGVKDKRMLVIEEEFAQVLRVMRREGNILSPTLRDAWDGKDLHPLTKSHPICATGAHISVIGHITKDELLRYLTETETGNGFANRFIWLVVERSKIIPNPTGVSPGLLKPLVLRLKEAVTFASSVQRMQRDKHAEAYWAAIYYDLSEGKLGLVGAVTSRAEAQVLRLSCLYALLDRSNLVRLRHLMAAEALWEYSEASVKLIFGNKLGNPTADRILSALTSNGPIAEAQIHDLFGRHRSGYEINQALDLLVQRGLAEAEVQQTGGRPRTVWQVL